MKFGVFDCYIVYTHICVPAACFFLKVPILGNLYTPFFHSENCTRCPASILSCSLTYLVYNILPNFLIFQAVPWYSDMTFHGWSIYIPVCRPGGPVSIPGQSVWDFLVSIVALVYVILGVFPFSNVIVIPTMLHMHVFFSHIRCAITAIDDVVKQHTSNDTVESNSIIT